MTFWSCPQCGATPGISGYCTCQSGKDHPMNIDKERDAISSIEYEQFLSDVMTAAGLVSHGKQCKDLGRRLAEGVMRIRHRAALDEQKAGPSEEAIIELARKFDNPISTDGFVHYEFDRMGFARALLSKYAAPAPKGEPVACLWVKNGIVINAFPHPPGDQSIWDPDGYWAKLGFERKPLYAAPVLTNWPDGTPRDERDIASDPEGKLIHDPNAPLRACAAPAPKGEDIKSPWPYCAWDGTCSCAKFHDNPDECERRYEREVMPPGNEQDAKDAQRYRDFRAAMAKSEVGFFFRIEEALKLIGVPESIAPNEEQIDAAFDAAIAQQGKEG